MIFNICVAFGKAKRLHLLLSAVNSNQILMNDTQSWYIVKHPAGHCEIITVNETQENQLLIREHWGPFASQAEAIARRVGLIRSGKCQPV